MYDLTHTVLPTKLPRKEFYRYYRYLYTRGNAMKNIITILKKYEKKDIVPFIMKAMKYFNRLKNIHCDYIGVGAE
jgi:predicted amidophosphoribosyltransferase